MSSRNRRALGLFKLLTAAACCVGAASLWGDERKAVTRFEISNDVLPDEVLEVTNLAVEASSDDLQGTYLELHRQLAERLTPEQLAEKCKALEQELNERIAEDEIQQIQKQLFDLKKKNTMNRGISTRLQRAIEALENAPHRPEPQRSESFKSL